MSGKEGYVSVYMPDRTVVGKGIVSGDGKSVIITLDEKYSGVPELISENLISMSFSFRDRDRANEIIEAEDIKKEMEKTDGK